MPQAPGLTPTAQPGVYAPEVNLGVPVDAFGGAVGHALEGLGGQIEQASDRIWQRAVEMQGLQNETEAKNADAQFMQKAGIAHEQFLLKEGANASKAYPDYIQSQVDLRQQVRNSLSNPAAQRMFDGSSISNMGSLIRIAAGHAGRQDRVAANGASDARIATAKTAIGDNPEDDNTVSRQQRVIETEVEAKGRTSGWTPEQIDATKQSEVSEALAHRILGISKTNAPKAQRMLDDAIENKAITPQIAEKIQGTVQTAFRDQGSRFISDKVLSGRRSGDEENKPVQEYIDAGLEEAKKYSDKDPMFADFVRNRIVADYNRQKAIETDTDNMNTRTIGQALIKTNQEGLLPTTIEELKAIDPAVGPAWDAISRDPKKQQAVLNQLKHNAQSGRVVETPENLQTYHRWRGQGMNGTDEERAAFMAHDFGSESKMTLRQRDGLMKMQEQLTHRAAIAATDDPRVSRALRYLKPDMEAAGISPHGSADARKDYFAFVSSIQDQLDQYQHEHPGKPPSHDELRSMAVQLMQEQHTHWWQSSQKFYQLPAPEEDLKALREDPYWKSKGATPSDEMLTRIWRARKFQETFGGSAKKSEGIQFPPNVPGGAL